jgi:uncharacterized phage-like protein YoqJ
MESLNFAKAWDYPKERAACFTGHRPEKLRGCTEKTVKVPPEIEAFLRREIETAVKDGICLFYNGLARGVDLWAAQIVLDMRSSDRNIALIGVLPYPGHGKFAAGGFGRIHEEVCRRADMLFCTSDVWHKGTYLIRDEYMVDHSSRLIGVLSSGEEDSGTAYTISYARKMGLETRILDLG